MLARRGVLIRVLSVALIVAAGAAYLIPRLTGADKAPAPHVIVISIDTCRADYLGCYNPSKALTPHIDRFAETATLFGNAVAPVPLTLPSHTSMLTGQIPLAHGVHQNASFVREDLVTLPEILADQGYTTGAIISHLVLGRAFGLDQGFGTYNDRMIEGGAVQGERRGEATSDLASIWLQRNAGAGPMFLLVHYFDPHEPYQAPSEFADRFGPDDAQQYAAEIAYVDAAVGKVLETLKKLDIYESSLIIITADHGEMLGDHGERDHGYFLYESAIKVPLIIKLPGQRVARRTDEVVGLIDITPTVCSAVGVDSPPDIQGRDLGPLLRGEGRSGEPRYLYCESMLPKTFYDAHPLLGMVGPRWKYIHSARPELYDLASNAQETDNLAAGDPPQLRELAGRLRTVFAQLAGEDSGAAPVDIDTRTREMLAGLGYIGVDREVTPALDTLGDDAKDLIEFHNAFHHDLRDLQRQQLEAEAIALCRELIAQRPGAVECHAVLASMLVAAGRQAEALAAYDTVVALAPGQPFLRLARGLVYAELGRPADAVGDFREVLRARPDHGRTWVALGDAYCELADHPEAEKAYLAALKISPEDTTARAGLSSVYLAGQDGLLYTTLTEALEGLRNQ